MQYSIVSLALFAFRSFSEFQILRFFNIYDFDKFSSHVFPDELALEFVNPFFQQRNPAFSSCLITFLNSGKRSFARSEVTVCQTPSQSNLTPYRQYLCDIMLRCFLILSTMSNRVLCFALNLE